MDMSQYRDLFISESRRHIEASNALVVRLENEHDPEIVHELFRHAHSLKGMAATMQFDRIADLAHKQEDLLGKIRDGAFSPTADLLDIILEANDLLGNMVTLIEAGNDSLLPDTGDMVKKITGFTPGEDRPCTPENNDIQLESALRGRQFRNSDSFKTVRVKTETLDRMVNITGELITTHHRLADRLHALPETGLNEPLAQLSTQLRELRDEVFLARMLPFSVVAERFPRLVRDLSRSQGKNVRLSINDSKIELDRGILEDISEPLVHILRNAVDHGIEPPQVRVSSGKPSTGRIAITLARDKDQVTIAIADDGRGMDSSRLAEKAVERGLISAEQAAAISPQEALMLICAPGFSTAETVTDISGRGVGMDAVRSAVRNLGGSLSIESTPGLGSDFRLKLPLTVSIIQALLVECGSLTVAFPVNAVERTIELSCNDISVKNGEQYCTFDGAILPLQNLHKILGCSLLPSLPAHIPVIVCNINGKEVGLIADRISGQREIFVKPLGKPLSHIRIATGGAIMGDGRIVFIMDVGNFLSLERTRAPIGHYP